MKDAGQFLRLALRGDQPYWRAYSLFAMHLAIVLIASWCIIELSQRSAGEDLQTGLRWVALLILSMGPTLQILWACARNIHSDTFRVFARGGVAAAVVLLAYLVHFFWTT